MISFQESGNSDRQIRVEAISTFAKQMQGSEAESLQVLITHEVRNKTEQRNPDRQVEGFL